MTKALIESFILPEGISDGITLPLAPTERGREETGEVPPRSAGNPQRDQGWEIEAAGGDNLWAKRLQGKAVRRTLARGKNSF